MKYDRRALIINSCGLAVALVLVAENIYINYRVIGWIPVTDYWWLFVPAVVMFLIGQRTLCYLLCAMYSLMAVYIGYIALKIYFDVLPPYHHLIKGLGFVHG